VPDIGLGEIIVIVVIALLVFGPDRLPKVAADAARMLRQVRVMAASARKDLVDAAGLEDDGEMAQVVRDIKDLDPRRAVQGVLTDDPAPAGPASAQRPGHGAPGPSAPRPAPTSAPAAAGDPTPGRGATPGAGAHPVAPAVVDPAQADPDWT
jgi:sec-independent protein translocase protein TatB